MEFARYCTRLRPTPWHEASAAVRRVGTGADREMKTSAEYRQNSEAVAREFFGHLRNKCYYGALWAEIRLQVQAGLALLNAVGKVVLGPRAPDLRSDYGCRQKLGRQGSFRKSGDRDRKGSPVHSHQRHAGRRHCRHRAAHLDLPDRVRVGPLAHGSVTYVPGAAAPGLKRSFPNDCGAARISPECAASHSRQWSHQEPGTSRAAASQSSALSGSSGFSKNFAFGLPVGLIKLWM